MRHPATDIDPLRAGVRRVSLIVPMLDEADYVEGLVADIAAQDYSGDIELLVADGGSTDGSPERLQAVAAAQGVQTTVLENTAGWVSHGLNQCIRVASGDLLVRLDCHSRYPRDYVRRCAEAAEETGAHVVGGVIVARGDSVVERAVACAMDSPFGGIGFYRPLRRSGNVLARTAASFGLARSRDAEASKRVDTDTLTFGAFRPGAFELAGLFDESLRRNQDADLNLRVRAAGGRVVLDRTIRVFYTPRDSLRAVFLQYHDYGYWRSAMLLKHRERPSARTVAPFAFVVSLGGLAALAPFSALGRRLLAVEVSVYGSAAAVAAVASVRRRRDSPALAPVVVAAFPAFHVGHGSGMVRRALTALVAAARGRDPVAR